MGQWFSSWELIFTQTRHIVYRCKELKLNEICFAPNINTTKDIIILKDLGLWMNLTH